MSRWSSTAARYFWKDCCALEGGGEGAQTQLLRGTQGLSRPCTSRAACIFRSTNTPDIPSNFLGNLNRDSCLLFRHVLNTEKKKKKYKAALTWSLFPKDAAGVLYLCHNEPLASSNSQSGFSVVNLYADNIGCLINNCASKMNTGEGTCFPLLFHPAALVNGFRNSSKYPDSNLVQFSPRPFLEGRAVFPELSSAARGCALDVGTEADSWIRLQNRCKELPKTQGIDK